jgi:hypothetical protein
MHGNLFLRSRQPIFAAINKSGMNVFPARMLHHYFDGYELPETNGIF